MKAPVGSASIRTWIQHQAQFNFHLTTSHRCRIINSYLPLTGNGTLPASPFRLTKVQLYEKQLIPCHPLHAPSPRQPWQTHHWLKCRRSHLCLYSSVLQLVPQNQGGESETRGIKTNRRSAIVKQWQRKMPLAEMKTQPWSSQGWKLQVRQRGPPSSPWRGDP